MIKLLNNRNTKAGIWYIGGNLFDKAFIFLTIPIFTRLLDPYDYGIVNTFLSWVAITALVIGLSLSSSIRNAYVDHKKDMDNYMASIMYLSILSFVLISSLSLLIIKVFFNKINIVLVLLCLFQGYMSFIVTSISQQYMMEFEYKKNTFLMIIPHILIALFSIIGISTLTYNKYFGRIIPNVAVISFIGISYLIFIFKKARIISTRYWKYALLLSLPLIVHGLSMNILSHSDRIMITAFRSAAETGVYSLIYNISMVAVVFSASLDSVWIPWFTQKMQNNNKLAINKAINYYIELMLIIITGLLFISPEIIKIFAPKEYWSGISIIPPIILSSFIMYLYTIEVHIEYYYKATKQIAINTCIAAVVNVILNFIFIPKYGALAAAFTTLAAYTVSFTMHYINARKLDRELISIKKYLFPIAFAILASLIVYIFLYNIIIRWSIAIIIFITYSIYCYKTKRICNLSF